MNAAASNALLKTLEEPAPTSHIFLIASRPDSLLQTIRSRCQMLRFGPVSAVDIERYLLSRNMFSPEETAVAARLANGSIGRAVSIDLEKFRAQREAMLSVLRNILFTADRAALLRVAEEMSDAKNRESFDEVLTTLQTLIHDIWLINLADDESAVVNADIIPQLKELASRGRTSRLASWLDEIERMRDGFEVNVNRKIAADALFMEMAS
jgi:DNA polymerase III subunit delta'